MKTLRLKLLAARIELNWWLIRRERLKGKQMLQKGFSYSSKEMLSLNRRYSKHCTMAIKAQNDYEQLAGIRGFSPIMQA